MQIDARDREIRDLLDAIGAQLAEATDETRRRLSEAVRLGQARIAETERAERARALLAALAAHRGPIRLTEAEFDCLRVGEEAETSSRDTIAWLERGVDEVAWWIVLRTSGLGANFSEERNPVEIVHTAAEHERLRDKLSKALLGEINIRTGYCVERVRALLDEMNHAPDAETEDRALSAAPAAQRLPVRLIRLTKAECDLLGAGEGSATEPAWGKRTSPVARLEASPLADGGGWQIVVCTRGPAHEITRLCAVLDDLHHAPDAKDSP
jgi:hypothetical protein